MMWELQIMMLCQPVVITNPAVAGPCGYLLASRYGAKGGMLCSCGAPRLRSYTALWGTPLAFIYCVWLQLTFVVPRRLATRPEEWLAEGTWRGMMQEAVWDEDDDMLMLRPRPAVWCPPDAAKGGFRRAHTPSLVGRWVCLALKGLLSVSIGSAHRLSHASKPWTLYELNGGAL